MGRYLWFFFPLFFLLFHLFSWSFLRFFAGSDGAERELTTFKMEEETHMIKAKASPKAKRKAQSTPQSQKSGTKRRRTKDNVAKADAVLQRKAQKYDRMSASKAQAVPRV
jgi:hypothetical protein